MVVSRDAVERVRLRVKLLLTELSPNSERAVSLHCDVVHQRNGREPQTRIRCA